MNALIPFNPDGIGPNTASGRSPSLSKADSDTPFWGEDGFTFADLVDLVNPLQHIPVVSWAYRAITSDQISPGAMALGSGLFGGVAGLAIGAAQGMIQSSTGKDTGSNLLAMFQQNTAPNKPSGDVAMTAARSDFLHPSLTQDRPPVLTSEQISILLASVAPSPKTEQDIATPLAKAPPLFPSGIGNLGTKGQLNPMFLPLIPMAGGAFPDTPSNQQEHHDQPPPLGETFDKIAVAEAVGQEIMALFNLN